MFAVKTVGEKRRIFAGSSFASLALTACATALTVAKPKTKFKVIRRQTILIDNSFLGGVLGFPLCVLCGSSCLCGECSLMAVQPQRQTEKTLIGTNFLITPGDSSRFSQTIRSVAHRASGSTNSWLPHPLGRRS